MGAPSKYTKTKAVVGYSVLLSVLLLTLFFLYSNINILTQVEESTSLHTDSITSLVHKKDSQLIELIESVSSLNADLGLISQDLDKLLDLKANAAVQKNILTTSDTVVTKPKKKKFFKRLAEAFVPSKGDSTVQVTRSVEMAVDTVYGTDKEEHQELVKEIQDKLKKEEQAIAQQKRKARELENLNGSITSQIDSFLVDYEQERLADLLQKMNDAEMSRHRATRWIGVIAFVAVCLAVFFCFLLLRDITKRNRYRIALEKSNKRAADLLQAREKLMLTITHDIKAPVGTIMGYAELMDQTVLNAEQKEYLKHMNVATSHVFKLVYDLLDYHSLDLNKADINLVSFHLADFVEEVYQSFIPQFNKQGLAFNSDFKKDDLNQWVVSDPIRIKQILNNLISNALKFTDHGSVQLGVRLDEEYIVFRVADTGRGMSEEEKETVFQEFTRLASAQGKEGFGLGLSIVYKIIHRLGGSIFVESKLGEGTEFTVELPVEIKDAVALQEKSALDFPPHTRIVLMDDDQIQLELTMIMLEKHGAKVVTCNHLNELLDALKSDHFDLLITDIQMPEINGFDLVELLRNSNYSSFQSIPILAVSARDQIDSNQMIKHGFIGVLKKPFSAYEVITKYFNHINGVDELNRMEETVVSSEIETGRAALFTSAELAEFVQGDTEAITSILTSFLTEATYYKEELHSALESEDLKRVAATCHRMYPVVKMIGSQALSNRIRYLDQKEPTYKKEECRMEVNLLLEELEQLTLAVRAYISSSK